MSHIATVDLQVKDLTSLSQAAEACGLELVRDQLTYRCWYTDDPDEAERSLAQWGMTKASLVPEGISPDDMGKCDHALRLRGRDDAYEIGVVRRPDGRGFFLVWDEVNLDGYPEATALRDAVGAGSSKLKREYAFVVARNQAMAQGFRVSADRRANGSIRMVMSK